MGKTKKTNSKQAKTKKNKMEKEDNLEDLYSDSDIDSDTGTETGSEIDEHEYEEFSLSKELDKAFSGSFDDIKDSDMTLPFFGIGFSLIAIIGFAIYKGSAV